MAKLRSTPPNQNLVTPTTGIPQKLPPAHAWQLLNSHRGLMRFWRRRKIVTVRMKYRLSKQEVRSQLYGDYNSLMLKPRLIQQLMLHPNEIIAVMILLHDEGYYIFKFKSEEDKEKDFGSNRLSMNECLRYGHNDSDCWYQQQEENGVNVTNEPANIKEPKKRQIKKAQHTKMVWKVVIRKGNNSPNDVGTQQQQCSHENKVQELSKDEQLMIVANDQEYNLFHRREGKQAMQDNPIGIVENNSAGNSMPFTPP
ncbi:hypothetical protein KY290_000585 [Solanum tuberosum]|uniref:Uncharacterized protein n=1 Tax=Solanum tuberosum TaxID=4113 RepID=A0ABQ7WJR0_SOLTU|nr:hypothetical protein KY289_000649 [Solanum tuberosum]KAH0780987.1 hypothetical protein KY290_000585 [Solanum tuberosum]